MPSPNSYLSIASATEGIYSEKGSKFIACAFPIEAESELKDLLESVRKKYPKARHYCYAYQIGADKKIYRTQDDGEPSGTAGKPIYNQLLSQDLSDVLVIVVRYFGGILLGTSGLIHAYKTAAAEALNQAQKIEKIPQALIDFQFSYSDLNELMRIVKQKHIQVLEKSIQEECNMRIRFPKSDMELIQQQLKGIPSIKFL